MLLVEVEAGTAVVEAWLLTATVLRPPNGTRQHAVEQAV